MVLQLQSVPPFRLDLTVWALRRDYRNRIDRWNGREYRRVLLLGDTPVETLVTQTAPPERPQLAVEFVASRPGPRQQQQAAQMLTHLLGLDLDLGGFHQFAAGQQRLGVLARRFQGLRPPCFLSVWEALVNAVSCQQLSLTVGILLMNLLAERFGPASHAGSHAFPRPADLGGADIADLQAMGYSRNKAGTILELAQAVAEGRLDLEAVHALDDETAVDYLTRLKGIGRWSAQYVLLRGLRRLNVFPADDVGFQNKLAKWLHLDERLNYEGVHRVIKRWRTYGGIIYYFMLLNHLQEQGHLKACPATGDATVA
ncbi:MAG: hypothetical protein LLG01_11845 [Planctomycetaceae bacterium]|nr:hypothetical protein [Planctomycetaceae bacterium]